MNNDTTTPLEQIIYESRCKFKNYTNACMLSRYDELYNGENYH